MKSKFISKILLFSIVLLLSSCAQDKIESLEIAAPDGGLKLTVGETYKLAAIVVAPEDFSIKLEWESSNDAVATVFPFRNDSQNAQLTAKSVGSCVITARAGKRSQDISVEVVESREKR